MRLGRSKTDQEGQGRAVALPYGSDPQTCPVRAMQAWLERRRLSTGPVFRAIDRFGRVSAQAVHAGFGRLPGEARRRGVPDSKPASMPDTVCARDLATQAAMNGASELAIMKQTGHRSLATVRKYIREGTLFRDNAAAKLGL